MERYTLKKHIALYVVPDWLKMDITPGSQF